MLWVCSIILSVAALSCAAPQLQALSAQEISERMELLVRKVRALPYGGANAPADKANAASPSGAVDAFLDMPIDPKADGGDSSSDVDSMIAQLEAEILALQALEVAPPPAPVDTAEVAAEVQEQAPAPQEQAPQPDPDPAQPGPDHSNKEDGDGDGNNGQQQQQDTGPGGVPEAPQAPEPAQQGNGVDWGNEDTKS